MRLIFEPSPMDAESCVFMRLSSMVMAMTTVPLFEPSMASSLSITPCAVITSANGRKPVIVVPLNGSNCLPGSRQIGANHGSAVADHGVADQARRLGQGEHFQGCPSWRFRRARKPLCVKACCATSVLGRSRPRRTQSCRRRGRLWSCRSRVTGRATWVENSVSYF